MRKNLPGILLLLIISFLIISPPVSYPQQSSQQELTEHARDLVQNLPKLKDTELWIKAKEIERLGEGVKPVIESGLKDAQPIIRLVCAKIIYRFGAKAEGVTTLLAILKEEKSKELQQMASDVLANLIRKNSDYGNKNEVAKQIEERLDEVLDPGVRLNLGRALFYANGSIRSVGELKDLLKLSGTKALNGELKYPYLRNETALTLAELGHFEEVNDILKELSKEPGEQGRFAQTLLDYKQQLDYEQKPTPNSNNKYDYRILDEMLELIKNYYVDSTKFNVTELITAAAKGLANSLDRFSLYETEAEKKSLNEDLNKKYGGIGAYIDMRDDILTISRPIYSGPAYKAGLRSLDKITEIEGMSTRGKSVDELVRKLKGEPGTPVKIKVYRKGWMKERDYVLTRAFIQIKTARYEILPGDIGFLSILTFGDTTARETADCLKEMKEKGVKSIIIDVRKNGGGYLNAVLSMLDMFLEKDKLLLTTKDKNGKVLEPPSYTKFNDKIDLPMFVLVDNGSASASEILSGVLQDYKKAKLIGEKTFGKGSVQHIWELKSTNGKAAFRMTIAKYYLPSDRCIHEIGLEPDIKISEADRDLWKDFALNKVIDSDMLDKYGEKYYAKNRELFYRLAEDDGLDPSRYPGFTEFFKSLKDKLETHLSENEVREVLRSYIRKKVEDERGKEFIVDMQIDVQLQRAIIEAFNELTIDPATIPAYKPFAHKFDKTVENTK